MLAGARGTRYLRPPPPPQRGALAGKAKCSRKKFFGPLFWGDFLGKKEWLSTASLTKETNIYFIFFIFLK